MSENRSKHTLSASLAPTVVNGQRFNSVMPALGMSDDDVSNVLTYVYNTWGNAGHDVTPADVAAVRRARRPAASAVAAH